MAESEMTFSSKMARMNGTCFFFYKGHCTDLKRHFLISLLGFTSFCSPVSVVRQNINHSISPFLTPSHLFYLSATLSKIGTGWGCLFLAVMTTRTDGFPSLPFPRGWNSCCPLFALIQTNTHTHTYTH